MTTGACRSVPARDAWREGTDHELAWWHDWLANRGGAWPDNYDFRLDPESCLQHDVMRHLDPRQTALRILDVGAGPLTSLGKCWPGHEVEITAVDALADEYTNLLMDCGIDPPIRTLRCDSEQLAERFPRNSFDLAYARNALDHAYEPMSAIEQMVELVRPEGVLLLEHYANEGEHAKYVGLHQWNFDIVDGACLLWQPGRLFNVADELGSRATVAGEKTELPRMPQIARDRSYGWVRIIARVNA